MLKDIVLRFLYPPQCPLCRASVSRHGMWCASCTDKYWEMRPLLSARQLPWLGECYALTTYDGPVRRLLHQLKYNGKESVGAACLYALQRVSWQTYFYYIDCVVPVPLAPEKLKARGFNQTELLFRPWAEAHSPWVDMLQRVRQTTAQWQLSKSERQENIQRAFSVKGSFRAAGKHILLVDDIFTTGATLDACAQGLYEKGAASVTGLVFASGAM